VGLEVGARLVVAQRQLAEVHHAEVLGLGTKIRIRNNLRLKTTEEGRSGVGTAVLAAKGKACSSPGEVERKKYCGE
jgi:hypothetical protein